MLPILGHHLRNANPNRFNTTLAITRGTVIHWNLHYLQGVIMLKANLSTSQNSETESTPKKRAGTPILTFSPYARVLSSPDLTQNDNSKLQKTSTEITNEIVEANTIAEIIEHIKHIKPGALIVFDLDNTVYEPKQLIGSDQWFEAHIKHMEIVLGPDQKKTALHQTVDLYNHVQKHTEVKSVEERTAEFINDLHEHHTVIALTTRGKELTAATLKQLESIDVSFNLAEHVKDKEVDLSSKGPYSTAKHGVIFAGGRDKGACLLHYLEELGCHEGTFSEMVFIDDKRRNVEQVAAAAEALGISFLGIRYGHLDHKIPKVDLKLSAIQLEHHKATGKFPDDAEAAALLSKQQSSPKSPKLRM